MLWRSTESGTSSDSAEAATNGMTIVIGPIQLLDANALGRLERLRAFAHGALEQLSADQQRVPCRSARSPPGREATGIPLRSPARSERIRCLGCGRSRFRR